MRITILTALAFVMASCATSTIFYSGENLFQKMPLPEDSWVAYEKQDGNVYHRFWVKNDGNDQMMTDVFRGTKLRSVEREKSVDDKVGNEKCQKFESSNVLKENEAGYNSLTWVSSCETKGGMTIGALHKAISGNDSFYHLRRIWNAGYGEEQLTVWKAYFKTIHVCDTRSSGSNRCPDGYNKVQ